MLRVEDIKEYLQEGNRFFVENVRLRSSDGAIVLYVPKKLLAERASNKTTSERQIENVLRNLRDKYSVEVIAVYTVMESHQDLEASLYEVINFQYEGKVKSLFISFSGEGVIDFWLEVTELTEELKDEIVAFLENTLGGEQYQIGQLNWLASKSDLPTKIVILRLIKTNQPIGLVTLLGILDKQYSEVDKRWLNRELDQLRKKKLVHWQKPDQYVLTYGGLAAVPGGTRRSSSDIERALALGRKKW